MLGIALTVGFASFVLGIVVGGVAGIFLYRALIAALPDAPIPAKPRQRAGIPDEEPFDPSDPEVRATAERLSALYSKRKEA